MRSAPDYFHDLPVWPSTGGHFTHTERVLENLGRGIFLARDEPPLVKGKFYLQPSSDTLSVAETSA